MKQLQDLKVLTIHDVKPVGDVTVDLLQYEICSGRIELQYLVPCKMRILDLET